MNTTSVNNSELSDTETEAFTSPEIQSGVKTWTDLYQA